MPKGSCLSSWLYIHVVCCHGLRYREDGFHLPWISLLNRALKSLSSGIPLCVCSSALCFFGKSRPDEELAPLDYFLTYLTTFDCVVKTPSIHQLSFRWFSSGFWAAAVHGLRSGRTHRLWDFLGETWSTRLGPDDSPRGGTPRRALKTQPGGRSVQRLWIVYWNKQQTNKP